MCRNSGVTIFIYELIYFLTLCCRLVGYVFLKSIKYVYETEVPPSCVTGSGIGIKRVALKECDLFGQFVTRPVP